ncbi:MAG: peptidylprolyl isomerase [bacterium]|nr:peptidylprolyl isomerase [bacterium]
MKKKILCLMLGLILLTGCGKIPQLENGQDAVVSFKNGDMISVDDLYNELKDKYALSTLLNMIDKKVLEETFPDNIEKAKKSSESYIESLKENYNSEEELLSAIQQYYGYITIEEYQNQIYLGYMQSYAMNEYAKEKVTDNDIEKYYKNEIDNDIEISHILITPEVTDKMNKDEIKQAETDAEKKAEDIISELKNYVKNGKKVSEAFSELAKKYSEDDATKDKGGSLGQVNKTTLGDTYTEIVEKAYTLKDDNYYTKVIKTSLGYHIIMRNQTYEKKSLDELKDEIIEILANDITKEDNTLSINALQHYRKQMGVNIEDSTLATQYSNYITNSLASLTSQDK